MTHKTWTLLAALTLAFSSACGGEAALGEACEEEGAEGECEDGAVCAKNTSEQVVCLTQCTEQTDCKADEECNGVSGSSLKACRTKTK